MLSFFKFPNATYLTKTLFNLIQENLAKFSEIINEPKSMANLTHQYSLYFLFKVMAANFSALNFCTLSLQSLLKDNNYKVFLETYKLVIVKLSETGFLQEFQDTDEGNLVEMQSLWEEIVKIGQKVMSNSMNMIYADIKDILQNLESSLQNVHDQKQAENCSIFLNYLGMPENSKKLL